MTRERAAHEARMARLSVQSRKADAHRKIVLGGALLAFSRLSPDEAAPILAALAPLIVRRCDRLALGLPVLSDDVPSSSPLPGQEAPAGASRPSLDFLADEGDFPWTA